MAKRSSHIALDAVWVNDRWGRQRCGWCGLILLDYDLERVRVPDSDPGPPAMFPAGTIVLLEEGMATTFVGGVPRLPADSCATIETKAMEANGKD